MPGATLRLKARFQNRITFVTPAIALSRALALMFVVGKPDAASIVRIVTCEQAGAKLHCHDT